MTDFKAGDKVVVENRGGAEYWTDGKIYTVIKNGGGLGVSDNEGFVWAIGPTYRFTLAPAPAPAPDADGWWYPMPKLKAGDPIPEWLVDPETEYRSKLQWPLKPISVYVSIGRFLDGTITHYRPAPKTETATTSDGKEYRITHNPDGSMSAEVV